MYRHGLVDLCLGRAFREDDWKPDLESLEETLPGFQEARTGA